MKLLEWLRWLLKKLLVEFPLFIISFSRKARTLFWLAHFWYYKMKNHKMAIKYLERAIRIDADDMFSYYLLATIYFDLGQYDKAKEQYELILQHIPNDDVSLNNIGLIYFKEQNHQKAIEHYTSVTASLPNDELAYYNLGVAHELIGNISLAYSNYKKALEINPQSEDAKIAYNKLKTRKYRDGQYKDVYHFEP